MSSDGSESPEQQTNVEELQADLEEGNSYDTLITHYKKLIDYKNNIFKTDALLAIEKDPLIQEEVNKVRASIFQAISYEEDVIKFTQNSDDFYFSTEILTPKYVDRLCRFYHKPENRWLNAKIESVDMESQEAEVALFGPGENRLKIHGCFIKLIPAPEEMNFQVGTQCEAIYSGDGKYYPCTIEKISEAGYSVKFKKYNNKENVTLYHLREIENGKETLPDVSNMTEFKMPDHLKILPNDSEAQRKKKKKKQKALKSAFKTSQIEKASSAKQNQWQNFNSKSAGHKKGHWQANKHRESIFKTSDSVTGKVGVTGSGQAMTGFREKSRYNFENEDDNPQ